MFVYFHVMTVLGLYAILLAVIVTRPQMIRSSINDAVQGCFYWNHNIVMKVDWVPQPVRPR